MSREAKLQAMFNRWVDDLEYAPPEERHVRIKLLLWRAWQLGVNQNELEERYEQLARSDGEKT